MFVDTLDATALMISIANGFDTPTLESVCEVIPISYVPEEFAVKVMSKYFNESEAPPPCKIARITPHPQQTAT